MSKKLVIVESPAKAKTINKFLGKDYVVVASYGHVRDLKAKNGSVDVDNDFAMIYEVNPKGKQYLNKIIELAKNAESILMATDPDREGEAISWHISSILVKKKIISDIKSIKRVVFTEITKNAIEYAVQNPRSINMNLVDAQQARRALDYLVGFNLSPILWRKLPGCKSAGRVQSVALKLVAEREIEIEDFVTEEYWTIHAKFSGASKQQFNASLNIYNNEKLQKFSITNENQANEILEILKQQTYFVENIEKKPISRKAAPPFITSTLQQEASRKLGFSAKKTMKVAQELYEGIKIDGETIGLITYMRTDGVTIAKEALSNIINCIKNKYSEKYLPPKPNFYKSKAPNAQEAHEAIRPTYIDKEPINIASFLSHDQKRLYDLIWKRTIASQMAPAKFESTTVIISSKQDNHKFKATGSVKIFDGFYKVYQEGKDDENEENDSLLPKIEANETLKNHDFNNKQHFTDPPPRYTEASLIKKLEEMSIGRPSTYSSIISVIQERDYAYTKNKRFFCNDRGLVVTTFLENFFTKYIEYDFTAQLENSLDEVSDGKLNWIELLRKFWNDFNNSVNNSKNKTNPEIIECLTNDLESHFFKNSENEIDRTCPDCKKNSLVIKSGKFGIFISCNNYPECKFLKPITKNDEDEATNSQSVSDQILGTYPDSGEDILVKKGPYGMYLQTTINNKIKRSAIPKDVNPENVTLDFAIKMLSLPKELGTHPTNNQIIKVGLGRFGPFVQYEKNFVSIPPEYDLLTISLEQAIKLIDNNDLKKKGRELGIDPNSKETIIIANGRYGEYIKLGKKNIPIPKKLKEQEITLQLAIEIIMNAKK